MVKLTEKHAQSIVNHVMNVIPYNINIMDEKGVIIGSGDENRLYQTHDGALEALAQKRTIEIYHFHQGMKPGINAPIFFQGKAIGVIGITGEPDEVRPLVELVRITAELLVNQEYIMNQQKIKEHQLEEFLYELAYKTSGYTKNFIERGLSLGVDLTIPRIAVTLRSNCENMDYVKTKLKLLKEKDEIYITLNPEILVFFIRDNKRVVERLQGLLKMCKGLDVYIGVGTKEECLAISLQNALRVLSVGKKLAGDNKIYIYEDFSFILTLANFKKERRLTHMMRQLEDEGRQIDLLNTLLTYIRMNGEVNKTAQELHIHRNTLNYRLEKIYDITGKDPRKLKDLLELFTAYVLSFL